MIKTIIKRNKSREPFSPEKLNGWGEWASTKLGRYVNWPEVVLRTVSTLPAECTSETLQKTLIKVCIDKATWEYSLMAGKLYAALMMKVIHKGSYPSVMHLHGEMIADKIMVPLNYSKEDYDAIEKMIDHSRDYKSAHYELHQIRYKYSLRNKVTGKEYETPQFVYMRMAMALAEDEPIETRLTDVKAWYDHFSNKRINAPTPYYTNLGTTLNGYASCCLYSADDSWPSLLAGDVIAYSMTCMSAGIGSHIKTRSIGDSIRNGLIQHQGKIPYYRALVGMINANLQNGRGGAATMHYTAFDPEVEVISKLKNPMTPAAKQVRGIDYSFGSNKFFVRKVRNNEEVALFSVLDAPELYEAQYSKDPNEFERKYNEFLASDKPRIMVPARKIALNPLMEAFDTGRHYLHFTDLMNSHTPFIEPVRQSNLCQEIALVTKPFKNVAQLYEQYSEDHGEIATCNIAGIIPSNIDSDEQYADVAYYALKMIDKGIHKSTYVFPTLEHTAKARMNAGVGVIGLAHLMAKNNKRYASQEGRDFIHEVFETHAWHLYNASLRLGKEKGNAPWMHKTLWPKGWLPIDTYEKTVDELVTVENKRDWGDLRRRIIENGGIRNSVCIAHMPAESSSIASGTTNGVYPIRDFDLLKSNDTDAVHWIAPDSTKYRDRYDIAWDVGTLNMIYCYAIIQKWTDQTTSADLWEKIVGDAKVSTSQMLQTYINLRKYGVKTRYYQNCLTAKGIDLNASDDVGCGSGGCTL